MTIKKKLIFSSLSFLGLLIGIFITVMILSNMAKKDAVVINLAGRQRMLTQKLTKEALMYKNNAIKKENILLTAKLFDTTLKSLTYGGKAAIDLKMTKFVTLPPAQDKAISSQLQKVGMLKERFYSNLMKFLKDKDENALKYLMTHNVELLKEMNKAVFMMQKEAEKKGMYLDYVIIAAIIIGIFLAIISILVALKISDKIAHLIETTEKLATGDISVNIDVHDRVKDEIESLSFYMKKLIDSFNELVGGIKAATIKVETGSYRITKVRGSLGKSLRTTSEEIETTIATINKLVQSIHEESKDIVEVKNNSALITSNAEEMALGIEMVSSLILKVGELAQNSAATVEEMIEGVEKIANQISQADENMNELRGVGEKVKNTILNTVNEADAIAAEMETVSSAVNEQSASIENVAENAKKAQDFSENTLKKAKAGVETLHTLLDSILEIKDKVFNVGKDINELSGMAENIGNITDTIDEISEQTNLLALNAAIEAARAGEAGKGFAVVADEVRRLAERSSIAAKDIAQLIKDIQLKVENSTTVTDASIEVVENGTKLAEETSSVVEEIYKASEETKNFVMEITNATNEQANVSSQIAESIFNVKEKSDEILNISKELESAGEMILTRVDEMKTMISDINSHAQAQKTATETIINAVSDMSSAVDETIDNMNKQKDMVNTVVESIKASEAHIIEVASKTDFQAQASVEIESILENLNRLNDENGNNLEELVNIQAETQELTHELLDKVGQFILEVSAEVESAVPQHQVYFEKIAAEMAINDKIDDYLIKSHTDCDFGKWLVKIKKYFSDIPGIHDIETYHSKFHELIREAYEAFNGGDREKAGKLMDEANKLFNNELKGVLERFVSLVKNKMKQ